MGSEQTMSLFNYFKKVDKSASCAFKEVMKDLEPDTISSSAINVDLTANEKKSVSDLIENAEKETGKYIVMSPKISLFHKCVLTNFLSYENIAINLDLSMILDVKNAW